MEQPLPSPSHIFKLASQIYCTITVSPQRGCNVSKTQDCGTRPTEDRQVKTVLALSWQSSPQQNISMLTNLQAIPPPPPLSSTHPTIPFICLLICYVVYFPSICNGEQFGFMYEFNFLCFCLFVCLWKINVIIIIIIRHHTVRN